MELPHFAICIGETGDEQCMGNIDCEGAMYLQETAE